jgi:hypothetical protein
MLCDYLIIQKEYKISTEYWEASSGFGIDNQKDCDLLADEIDIFIEKKFKNDNFYVNLGKWVNIDGKFVSAETTEKLNKEYRHGFVLFSPLVTPDGELVVPIHKTTITELKEFVKFLRNCGGFKIW